MKLNVLGQVYCFERSISKPRAENQFLFQITTRLCLIIVFHSIFHLFNCAFIIVYSYGLQIYKFVYYIDI